MRYYLIVGEASGDLHASRLMMAIRQRDSQALFRFIGGDQMVAVGGTLVSHYRDLAYMGLFPVVRHLPTILRNMRQTKQDIRRWQPHCVILVDYPGFNLNIAKYVHRLRVEGKAETKVYYYISPKIWAWKEYRVKSIKRDVDELFSILPFEVDFFEHRHHYPIHYVGNPTYDEVREFKEQADPDVVDVDFFRRNALSQQQPLIAVLCGSRKQEIKDNLPTMLSVTDHFASSYQVVVAGAPGIDHDYYDPFVRGHQVTVLRAGQTYQLLHNAHAALVTSGTATLETALFAVPQVVCYATFFPRLIGFLRRVILKVKYVSLVNLIAGREVVPELVADSFTPRELERHLSAILQGEAREQMSRGYAEVTARLKPPATTGATGHLADEAATAPASAARIMLSALRGRETT